MFNKRILLIFAILCVTSLSANSTDLKQVDVNRVSDNSLDVTLYTTGSSVKPMVTRKAPNTYVILMPSVAGKNAGTPDLGNVKDLVTNVNVKNVDDGMNGYTKITFTTTKPLSIQTHLKRTTPITQEEKAAKTVIANAQATVKATNTNKSTERKVTTKPQAIKEIKEVKKVEKTVQSTETKSENIVKKTEPKISLEKKSKSTTSTAKKSEPKASVTNNLKSKSEVLPAKQENTETATPVVKKTAPVPVNINNLTTSKQPVKNYKTHLLMFSLAVLGLAFVLKIIKNIITSNKSKSVCSQDNSTNEIVTNIKYDTITDNNNLSWREKYKQFTSKTAKHEKNNNNYMFTTKLLNKTDKKRLELESTLSKTPEIYQMQPAELTEDKQNEVNMEENSIHDNMSSFKLKSFTNPVTLSSSHRNRYKKVLPKNVPLKEGKFVQLHENTLNKTKREFGNANLSVADLVDKGNKYMDKKTVLNTEYSVASVEEYLNLLDKSSAKADTGNISNKVAQDLRNIKPSISVPIEPVTKSMNLITNKKPSKDYLSGLIIKTSYNIDEHKSFHLVNLDGQNALIGRIDENIFVLKKFDREITNIQVRADKDDTYIIKAGSFKSVVGIENNKMGVLIEL